MKDLYIKPKMNILFVNNEDVISTSLNENDNIKSDAFDVLSFLG